MKKWSEEVVANIRRKHDQVISETGSRSFDRFSDKALATRVTNEMAGISIGHNPLFISCGAQGFDHYMARIVYKMEMPFILLIPSPDYPDYYWCPVGSIDHKSHYDRWEKMVDCALGVYYVNDNPYGQKPRQGNMVFVVIRAMPTLIAMLLW